MKTLYKIVIFLAVFQVVTLAVSVLGVDNGGDGIFPYTLYDDEDISDIRRNASDPLKVIGYIMMPEGVYNIEIPVLNIQVFSFELNEFSIVGLVTLLALVGAGVAMVTHHYAAVVIVVSAITIWPMLMNSYSMFRKLFENWNIISLTYIGIGIFMAIIILVVIHLLETPTHGRS